MAIEFDKNQTCEGPHKFRSVVIDNRFFGIACSACGKTCSVDLHRSQITVSESEIFFYPAFFEECKFQTTKDFPKQYHLNQQRKGHRF